MFTLAVKSPDGPQRLWIFNRDVVGIGRAEDNHLVLEDEAVSRHHAQIERRSGKYFVCDLGSRNGVTINGQVVREHELEDRDRIHLGETRIVFLAGRHGPPSSEREPAEPSARSGQTAQNLEFRLIERVQEAAGRLQESEDPSAQPPMATADEEAKWQVMAKGLTFAALTTEELRRKIEAGEIPPTAIAWTHGMSCGVAISDIPQFRQVVPVAPAPTQYVNEPSAEGPSPPAEPPPPLGAQPTGRPDSMESIAMEFIRKGEYAGVCAFLNDYIAEKPGDAAAQELLRKSQACLRVEEDLRKAESLWRAGERRNAIELLRNLEVPDCAPLLVRQVKDTLEEFERAEAMEREPDKTIVVCPYCGSKNRTPKSARRDGRYQCGKCRKSLDGPEPAGPDSALPEPGPADRESIPEASRGPRVVCRYCGQSMEADAQVCPICNHRVLKRDYLAEEFRRSLKTRMELRRLVKEIEAVRPPQETKPKKSKRTFFRRNRKER